MEANAAEPSVDPLVFVLEQPDPDRDRTADRSAGRVLEVVQIVGDAVHHVAHLRPGEVAWVGADAAFVHPSPRRPWIQREGDAWVATLDGPWSAFVDRGEERRGVDGARVVLAEGDRLVVDAGACLFVVQQVWPGKRLPTLAREAVDTPMLAITAFLSLATALLGVAAGRLPEPPSPYLDPSNRRLVELYLQKPPPPSPVPAAKEPAGGGSSGSPKVAKAERPASGQPSVKGTIDQMFDDDAVSDVLSGTLDGELIAGIQGLIGPKGTSMGAEGLHRCGGALCTGGPGVEGMGSAGLRPGPHAGPGVGDIGQKREPRITTDEPPLYLGPIDKSLVDQEVKRHLQRIRYCYQRQLVRDPTLGGKVVVKFSIAGDGTVSSATTKSTTLGSPAAESCVNNVFLTMSFPPLKGGGVAIVTYPFLFAPG
jgi:hypothetical protein